MSKNTQTSLTLIKETRMVGTSAGVILPISWINKQVSVTLLSPNSSKIVCDINEILLERGLNEQVKGIYLFGSYARGDYDYESDIDILVITENINKIIKEKDYEIVFISEDNIKKNLVKSLNLLSMIAEAKTIINRSLIEKYKEIELNPREIIKFLNEIEKIMNINYNSIKDCEENSLKIPDGIVYSIVLRLRELYLIKCLINDKKYNKKDFTKIIGENPYLAYLRIKRNKNELNNSNYVEIKKILDISVKWINEVKRQ